MESFNKQRIIDRKLQLIEQGSDPSIIQDLLDRLEEFESRRKGGIHASSNV